MKCRDVRTFLAEVADEAISTRIQEEELGFLASNGCIARISNEDHERAAAEVADLHRMTDVLQREREYEAEDEEHLRHDERHLHGILHHFEGRERKEAELADVEREEQLVAEERAEIAEQEDKVLELIKKKSAFDMQAQCGNEYLALTGLGVSMLHDLNIRNYRVANTEFSDFMDECRATTDALQAIAQRVSFYFNNIRRLIYSLPSGQEYVEYVEEDEMRRIRARGLDSQLWAVSIGLAKLQTDNESDLNETLEKYSRTLSLLEATTGFKSNLDSKVATAELIALSSMLPSEEQIQSLSDLVEQLGQAEVPEEQSIRIAATILCGGGSLEKFKEFAKISESYQAAAMLSTLNISSDELGNRFKSFKSVFDSWGYSASEDADLAAAYLSIMNFNPDDIGRDSQTKMITVVNGVKNDLEYPLLPAAILTSIAALNAGEVLDLMEKGAAILHSVAPDLERSELVSLAVRMVYGQ